MLPTSHITYTLAAFSLARKRFPVLKDVDYRILALAATGPDWIDKPLAAVYFYRHFKSAVLFAHTLLVHGPLFLWAIVKKPGWWLYALAFNGHAVLDRLWLFPKTFYWPFLGWKFHVWGKRGSEQQDMKWAYWYAFTRRPELWIWELGGVVAGIYFLWSNRLYRWPRLKQFLRSGRLPD